MEFVRVPCSLSPPTLCSICSLYSFSLPFPSLRSLVLLFSARSRERRRTTRAEFQARARARDVLPSVFCTLTRVTRVWGRTKAMVYFGLFYIVCRIFTEFDLAALWKFEFQQTDVSCKESLNLIARPIVKITFRVLFRLLLTIKV